MKLFSLLLLLPASVFIPKFLIHTWKEMPRRGAVGDLRFKKKGLNPTLSAPAAAAAFIVRARAQKNLARARPSCLRSPSHRRRKPKKPKATEPASEKERERAALSPSLSLPFSSAPRSETLYLPVQLSPLSPPLLVCTNFYPPTNYNRICR